MLKPFRVQNSVPQARSHFTADYRQEQLFLRFLKITPRPVCVVFFRELRKAPAGWKLPSGGAAGAFSLDLGDCVGGQV